MKNEVKLRSYMSDVVDALNYINSQGFSIGRLALESLQCHRQPNDLLRIVKITDLAFIQPLGTVINI